VTIDRRSFLKAGLAGAGMATLGGSAAARASDFVNITAPVSSLLGGPTPRSNINHVVVLMMENRSADHYLGWWGDRPDVRFDASTKHPTRPTYDFGVRGEQNFTGHPYLDPSHSHDGGRFQILDKDGADGVPDGWGDDRPGSGTDRYALTYYTADDLPVISQIVRDFTAFDRYHASWMGNTYPNRYYMHSAQAHGITNNDFPPQFAATHPEWTVGFTWPTLWDQLTAAGVTWRYYFSNLPVIALFGARYLPNARPIVDYYADAAAGTLPQVSFIDPFFVAPEGLANDDHPHADIRLGQELYSDVTTAFMRSPNWRRGAMFINYDEWGGFWDHVTPPAVGTDIDPLATYGPSVDYRQQGPWTTDATPDFGLHGFRTPAFLLSPYARNTGANPIPGTKPRGKRPVPTTVDRTHSGRQDHTSILQFITDNWGLPSTAQWEPGFSRRATSSMAAAFDPSAFQIGHPGDPEVDVDAYEYVAPLEARTAALPIPASSVSDLWAAADWIDAQGFTITTRFADALPSTRTLLG
jgi:phospholipase C